MVGYQMNQGVTKRRVQGSEAFARVAPQNLEFDIPARVRRVRPRRPIEETANAEAVTGLQHQVQDLASVMTQNRHTDRSGHDPVHFVSGLGLQVDPTAVRKVPLSTSQGKGLLRLS